MPLEWAVAAMFLAAVGTLIFSTLTYALRDFSRARLADYLERRHRARLLEPTLQHVSELIFITAVGRLLANTLIALASVWIFQKLIPNDMVVRDLLIFALAAFVTLIFSVALPQALSKYAGDAMIGACASALHAMRAFFRPINWVMHLTDRFVRSAAGAPTVEEAGQIERQVEEDILSAVEEGEERGVVDEQEREMIESVIELHDSTVAQIMTARVDIVSLDHQADIQRVKQAIESGGHSRIPIHEGDLDRIVGILYARDLLKYLGQPPERFDIRSILRPAFFVPETTPLGDLLHDFRQRKVHVALVLDEYGNTTGLVTLEDILKELVGPITAENDQHEPTLFKRIDEHTVEADARIDVEELNRLTGMSLPEDAGYFTLGGFVLAAANRVPEPGFAFEHQGVKFTVLDAEPQRVNRVRIDQIPQPAQSL